MTRSLIVNADDFGRTRGVLAREKNGQDIRSCVSRNAMSPGRARNNSSCWSSSGRRI